jgi:hypothetical protein
VLICDFCATPNPERKYLCMPFLLTIMMGIEQWSDEAWAACTVCAGLIDTDRWEDLLQCSIHTSPFKMSFNEKLDYKEFLRSVHQKFRVAKGQTA